MLWSSRRTERCAQLMLQLLNFPVQFALRGLDTVSASSSHLAVTGSVTGIACLSPDSRLKLDTAMCPSYPAVTCSASGERCVQCSRSSRYRVLALNEWRRMELWKRLGGRSCWLFCLSSQCCRRRCVLVDGSVCAASRLSFSSCVAEFLVRSLFVVLVPEARLGEWNITEGCLLRQFSGGGFFRVPAYRSRDQMRCISTVHLAQTHVP